MHRKQKEGFGVSLFLLFLVFYGLGGVNSNA